MAEQPAMESATETQNESVVPKPTHSIRTLRTTIQQGD